MVNSPPDIFFRWALFLSLLLHVAGYTLLQIEFSRPKNFETAGSDVAFFTEVELATFADMPAATLETAPEKLSSPVPKAAPKPVKIAPVAPVQRPEAAPPATSLPQATIPSAMPLPAPKAPSLAPERPVLPRSAPTLRAPSLPVEVPKSPPLPMPKAPAPQPPVLEEQRAEAAVALPEDASQAPKPRTRPFEPPPPAAVEATPENAEDVASDSLPVQGLSSDRIRDKIASFQATAGSELALMVKDQLKRCWRVPEGAPRPEELGVLVKFQVSRSGALVGRPTIVEGPPASEPFSRQARNSAIMAVRNCTPLRGLPLESYRDWKEIEILFEKEM
ncbi:MAG: hypothetical protein ACPGJH_06315 [Alphaproteobacteria bacterium]